MADKTDVESAIFAALKQEKTPVSEKAGDTDPAGNLAHLLRHL